MGGQLMMSAGVQYPHLNGVPYKALMKICATALDRPGAPEEEGDPPKPARWFYAGWEDVALWVGWTVPADTPANKKARKNMRGEMNKILKELAEAGAIEERPHPRDGRRKAWYVALDPRSTGDSPVESESKSTGDSPSRSTGDSPTDRRVIHPAPSIRREEDKREDQQLGAGAQVAQAVRAHGAAGDDEETRTLALLTAWAKVDYAPESCRQLVRQLLILDCKPEDVARQVANMGESVQIPDRSDALEQLLKKVRAPWPTAAGSAKPQ